MPKTTLSLGEYARLLVVMPAILALSIRCACRCVLWGRETNYVMGNPHDPLFRSEFEEVVRLASFVLRIPKDECRALAIEIWEREQNAENNT